MAIMGAADRLICYQNTIAEIMRLGDSIGLTKDEIKAAVNAADQWVSDNEGSYNTALPLPARTTLTAPQKAYLLSKVLERRYLTGT